MKIEGSNLEFKARLTLTEQDVLMLEYLFSGITAVDVLKFGVRYNIEDWDNLIKEMRIELQQFTKRFEDTREVYLGLRVAVHKSVIGS